MGSWDVVPLGAHLGVNPLERVPHSAFMAGDNSQSSQEEPMGEPQGLYHWYATDVGCPWTLAQAPTRFWRVPLGSQVF